MSSDALIPDRSHISTEKRNPRTMDLHALSVTDCVATMCREDRHAFEAVRRADHRISRVIEAIEPNFVAGGRLIYVGAGTSGRLGVLDASEAPPTFQIDPSRIVGIIAGGDGSLRKSSEGREDDAKGAWDDLRGLGLSESDTVLGIAAGGTTPYVLGALEFCKTEIADGSRPVTGLLTCAGVEPVPAYIDHMITLKTGAEVLTGSTRLKAGTATKLTLNIISTTLMIRLGKVYQNLMVDVKATNSKLRDRAARILVAITGLTRDECFALLDNAGGSVKVAAVMEALSVDRDGAVRLLSANAERLDRVLAGPGGQSAAVESADLDAEEAFDDGGHHSSED